MESSEARNSAIVAISSVRPIFPRGIRDSNCRFVASSNTSSCFAVATCPGVSTLTRMRRSFNSASHTRAQACCTALLPEYTLQPGKPLSEAFDPVMKIEPPSLNSGSAFCTVNSVPRAFRPKAASNCSSVISPSLPCSPIPALAHSTSIAPFSRRTVSNRRSRSSRSAASPCTAVTFRPISLTASSSASGRRPVMKTCAPSSTKSLAPASAMPVDPPVITATLPSSFPTITPELPGIRISSLCKPIRVLNVSGVRRGRKLCTPIGTHLGYAGGMAELEKGPQGRRRGRGARERILGASQKLFRDQGINRTGMDQLCEVAQVSKRTVYQHFDGKDEIVTEYLRRFDPDVMPGVFDRTDLTPRERLLAAFELPASGTDDLTPLCPYIAATVELHDPEHPASQYARDYKKAIAARLAETA